MLNKEYKLDTLPRLDLGISDFKKTRHYSYVETAPRVLDALIFQNVLYVTHNFYDKSSDSLFFKISMIEIGKQGKWTELWKSAPLDIGYFTLGNGGGMAIDGERLYFSIGDQGLDRKNSLKSDFSAQNSSQPWGKIYSLNLGLRHSSAIVTLCSIGHRNSQGLVLAKNGKLYSTEHGPRGGDEINEIVCGRNYGWPSFSYGTGYTSYGTFSDISVDARLKMTTRAR